MRDFKPDASVNGDAGANQCREDDGVERSMRKPARSDEESSLMT